ncbi:hypothetical protein B0H14DRAFT_2609270 [Mycena olivaceomarginata]|nr:hypothetical protein B0H14DRAFT_2609270 [Mycena olivaceomarginata]
MTRVVKLHKIGQNILEKAPGKTRKPEETVTKIKEQIRAACLGVAAAVEQLQTDSGVKDKISVHWIGLLIDKAREIQKQRIFNHETRDPRLGDAKIVGDARKAIKQGLMETIQEELYTWPANLIFAVLGDQPELRPGDYNVHLRLRSLDPHRDSPCEILHTILLGEDKYVWHETTKVWNDEQGALFAARLQSASLDGLNLPSLRSKYMVQYKKSLIGKHYKALQQLGIFQLDATLCSQEVFELWKANGVLGHGSVLGKCLLTCLQRASNRSQADLKVAIDNVLDRWAVVDPTQITQKYKLHVLPISPKQSADLAPSLDIATTLADMERFKHQVSGGWWKPVDGDRTQAGSEIKNFLTANRQLQRRLGWAPHDLIKPGTVKVLSKAKQQQPASWKTALATPTGSAASLWPLVRETPVTLAHGYFSRMVARHVTAGRIVKILVPEHTLEAAVVIQPFTISNTTDPRYDMPVLIKTGKTIVVKPEHLLFKFNAQHDCLHFSCPLVHSVGPQQERSESRLTQKLTAHKDDSRFLVNTHGLHNAHLVREALPRHLTAPKPCFADRRAKHSEFAAFLREVGPEKRALGQAKGQATKAKRKQDKADKVSGAKGRAGEPTDIT